MTIWLAAKVFLVMALGKIFLHLFSRISTDLVDKIANKSRKTVR